MCSQFSSADSDSVIRKRSLRGTRQRDKVSWQRLLPPNCRSTRFVYMASLSDYGTVYRVGY